MKKTNLILAGVLMGISASGMAVAMNREDIPLGGGINEKPASGQAESPVIPKIPMRVDVSSSDLYAYVVVADDGYPAGLSRTAVSGELEHMWSPAEDSWYMFNGWMCDGRVCGLVNYQPGGEIAGVRYQEYDLETGGILASTELEGTYMNWFTQCTYLPEERLVFGVGRDEKNWSCIKTMSVDDLSDIRIVTNINYTRYVVAMCYNPVDKEVYAVASDSRDLVRIDRETGDYETVMHLTMPFRDDYKQGLVYLPTEGEFLFAATLEDYSSRYYRIDTECGMILETAQLPGNDLVSYLVTTDPGDMEAPARPAYDSMNFPEGSLSGSFTFTLPTVLAGGNEAPAALGWKMMADGVEVAGGEGKSGGTVSAEVTLAQGRHIIEMSAINAGHTGPSSKIDVYVGIDTPCAPGNVVLSEGKVTWDAVTNSVNGGYMNLGEMVYEVYVDDEYVGETSETSLEYDVDTDAEFMRHRAEVKAVCGDYESESGFSNYCVYGAAMTLDVSFAPTEDEAGLFTTVSSDEPDALNWGWDQWEHTFGTTIPNGEARAWLVTPPLRFDDVNTVYAVDFDSMISMWSGGETDVAVMLGTSVYPEDMTKTLVDAFTPETKYTPAGTIFTVPAAGIYRIGFCVHSTDRSYQTYIKNITVRKTDYSPDAPAVCTDLAATAAEKGILRATVSFTMPAFSLAGREYAAGTEVEAVVTAGGNSVAVKGMAGAEQSVEIATVQGVNDISVVCSVDGNTGSTAGTSVYTGIDAPGIPLNFKAVTGEDNNLVYLSWDAPEEGANGLWFENKDITYRLGYKAGWNVVYFDEQLVDRYNATFRYEDGMLNTMTFVIVATNAGGSSRETSATTVVGDPYIPPVSDDFASNQYNLWPIYQEYPSEEYGRSYMYFQAPAYFSEIFGYYDHSAIGLFSTSEEESKSRLVLPKFSTKDDRQVAVYFHMWTGDLMAKEIRLCGRTYGMEEDIEIGRVLAGTGWSDVWFDIPAELKGKNWIEVYLDSEYDRIDTYTLIYSYGYTYSTGVGEVGGEEDSSIVAEGRYVYLSGFDGTEYQVCSLDGRVIRRGNVTGCRMAVGLDRGVYVVRCGGSTAKVRIS